MTWKKILKMCQSLHLSGSVVDAANEQKKSTPAFDRLCEIKPLYEEIREACKRNYHPISIDEQMVASKAHMRLIQHMKNKPVHWGYVLFVLADPVPPAVKEYNRLMGGVDLTDALIGYYKVLHKPRKRCRTFFYHFTDIAIVNAFILHKELEKGKGEAPLSQTAFRETQLWGLPPQPDPPHLLLHTQLITG